MRHERITLPETGVTLVAYLTDNRALEEDRRRPLALIFPGGGYEYRSDREAEPVALRLLTLGLNAAVVEYSVAPVRHPVPLQEAAEAVAYARAHAEEWLCDPHRILVMGFSAGGHAAAHIGVKWQDMPQGEACRPDAMILSYPVITGGEHAHRNSIRALLGERHDALCDAVSLEKLVSPQTPPTFLWHTWVDATVPVENSLLFASALRKNGVPCEMHIWQQGIHGLSLSNDQVFPWRDARARPEAAGWIDMAIRWFNQL